MSVDTPLKNINRMSSTHGADAVASMRCSSLTDVITSRGPPQDFNDRPCLVASICFSTLIALRNGCSRTGWSCLVLGTILKQL